MLLLDSTVTTRTMDSRELMHRLACAFQRTGRQDMNFHTRKWIKPEDLNPNGTLFGGSLLRWIDEEAAIYAIIQLDHHHIVTKYMSEINFVSSARQGDIIELGIAATRFGTTSLTMRCEVRNKITRRSILRIDEIVFVSMGDDGRPKPHGKTEVTYIKDRFAEGEEDE
tara:strand:- start:33 stop:536 length:504 start_codon:yes stop_codon:yes gene_type:complete